jgi:hypothetical protein
MRENPGDARSTRERVAHRSKFGSPMVEEGQKQRIDRCHTSRRVRSASKPDARVKRRPPASASPENAPAPGSRPGQRVCSGGGRSRGATEGGSLDSARPVAEPQLHRHQGVEHSPSRVRARFSMTPRRRPGGGIASRGRRCSTTSRRRRRPARRADELVIAGIQNASEDETLRQCSRTRRVTLQPRSRYVIARLGAAALLYGADAKIAVHRRFIGATRL